MEKSNKIRQSFLFKEKLSEEQVENILKKVVSLPKNINEGAPVTKKATSDKIVNLQRSIAFIFCAFEALKILLSGEEENQNEMAVHNVMVPFKRHLKSLRKNMLNLDLKLKTKLLQSIHDFCSFLDDQIKTFHHSSNSRIKFLRYLITWKTDAMLLRRCHEPSKLKPVKLIKHLDFIHDTYPELTIDALLYCETLQSTVPNPTALVPLCKFLCVQYLDNPHIELRPEDRLKLYLLIKFLWDLSVPRQDFELQCIPVNFVRWAMHNTPLDIQEEIEFEDLIMKLDKPLVLGILKSLKKARGVIIDGNKDDPCNRKPHHKKKRKTTNASSLSSSNIAVPEKGIKKKSTSLTCPIKSKSLNKLSKGKKLAITSSQIETKLSHKAGPGKTKLHSENQRKKTKSFAPLDSSSEDVLENEIYEVRDLASTCSLPEGKLKKKKSSFLTSAIKSKSLNKGKKLAITSSQIETKLSHKAGPCKTKLHSESQTEKTINVKPLSSSCEEVPENEFSEDGDSAPTSSLPGEKLKKVKRLKKKSTSLTCPIKSKSLNKLSKGKKLAITSSQIETKVSHKAGPGKTKLHRENQTEKTTDVTPLSSFSKDVLENEISEEKNSSTSSIQEGKLRKVKRIKKKSTSPTSPIKSKSLNKLSKRKKSAITSSQTETKLSHKAGPCPTRLHSENQTEETTSVTPLNSSSEDVLDNEISEDRDSGPTSSIPEGKLKKIKRIKKKSSSLTSPLKSKSLNKLSKGKNLSPKKMVSKIKCASKSSLTISGSNDEFPKKKKSPIVSSPPKSLISSKNNTNQPESSTLHKSKRLKKDEHDSISLPSLAQPRYNNECYKEGKAPPTSLPQPAVCVQINTNQSQPLSELAVEKQRENPRKQRCGQESNESVEMEDNPTTQITTKNVAREGETVVNVSDFKPNQSDDSDLEIEKIICTKIKSESSDEMDEASGSDGDIIPCDENKMMFTDEETATYHRYLKQANLKEKVKEIVSKESVLAFKYGSLAEMRDKTVQSITAGSMLVSKNGIHSDDKSYKTHSEPIKSVSEATLYENSDNEDIDSILDTIKKDLESLDSKIKESRSIYKGHSKKMSKHSPETELSASNQEKVKAVELENQMSKDTSTCVVSDEDDCIVELIKSVQETTTTKGGTSSPNASLHKEILDSSISESENMSLHTNKNFIQEVVTQSYKETSTKNNTICPEETSPSILLNGESPSLRASPVAERTEGDHHHTSTPHLINQGVTSKPSLTKLASFLSPKKTFFQTKCVSPENSSNCVREMSTILSPLRVSSTALFNDISIIPNFVEENKPKEQVAVESQTLLKDDSLLFESVNQDSISSNSILISPNNSDIISPCPTKTGIPSSGGDNNVPKSSNLEEQQLSDNDGMHTDNFQSSRSSSILSQNKSKSSIKSTEMDANQTDDCKIILHFSPSPSSITFCQTSPLSQDRPSQRKRSGSITPAESSPLKTLRYEDTSSEISPAPKVTSPEIIHFDISSSLAKEMSKRILQNECVKTSETASSKTCLALKVPSSEAAMLNMQGEKEMCRQISSTVKSDSFVECLDQVSSSIKQSSPQIPRNEDVEMNETTANGISSVSNATSPVNESSTLGTITSDEGARNISPKCYVKKLSPLQILRNEDVQNSSMADFEMTGTSLSNAKSPVNESSLRTITSDEGTRNISPKCCVEKGSTLTKQSSPLQILRNKDMKNSSLADVEMNEKALNGTSPSNAISPVNQSSPQRTLTGDDGARNVSPKCDMNKNKISALKAATPEIMILDSQEEAEVCDKVFSPVKRGHLFRKFGQVSARERTLLTSPDRNLSSSAKVPEDVNDLVSPSRSSKRRNSMSSLGNVLPLRRSRRMSDISENPHSDTIAGIATPPRRSRRISGISEDFPESGISTSTTTPVRRSRRVSDISEDLPDSAITAGTTTPVRRSRRIGGLSEDLPDSAMTPGATTPVRRSRRVSGISEDLPDSVITAGTTTPVRRSRRVSGISEDLPDSAITAGTTTPVRRSRRITGIRE